MICIDRLSGEQFAAENEDEIRAYLGEALLPGEIVAYAVETDDGQFFEGELGTR